MIDDERHIGVAIAIEHGDTVQPELCLLPEHAREDLMTRDRGSERQVETER